MESDHDMLEGVRWHFTFEVQIMEVFRVVNDIRIIDQIMKIIKTKNTKKS